MYFAERTSESGIKTRRKGYEKQYVRSLKMALRGSLMAISVVLVTTDLLADTKTTLYTSVLDYSIKEVLGVPEDAFKNFTELVQRFGFPAEQYEITTDDGYILTGFRIPHSNESIRIGNPVILSHGMNLNAECWILTSTDSLGYQLSIAGFDVWLINYRGTRYGRRHITLDPDTSADFWSFSFDEMAEYDLTKHIDYVLEKTGADHVSLVGHSQGATTFYALASEHSEYNSKVNVMVGLSPVAFFKNTKSPLLRFMAKVWPLIEVSGNLLGIHEIFGNGSAVSVILKLVCAESNRLLLENTCLSPYSLISGFDPEEFPKELLPVIYGHYPDGTSTQNWHHWIQLSESNYFQKFSHGTIGNVARYGSANPPQYKVQLVTAPVAHFISRGDLLANPIDVYRLNGLLKNVIETDMNPNEKWGHIDFLWGRKALKFVTKKVVTILKKYNGV